jgi:polyhydroxybutyrate depolymerase
MKRRTVLGFVLLCLGLPPALVLLTAATHHLEGRTTGTMTIAGTEREYIVHVPDAYDPATPTALVFSMHGALNWPSLQMQISRWNDTADRHGFIVVYPGGEGAGPKMFGQRGSRTPSEMPDVLFISALIDRLQSSFNIDPARIYANGLSNGGGISHALSCGLPERLAAVGMVAPAILPPRGSCVDAPPMPLILFHGTGDRFTPYHGGKVWIAPRPFPDIPDFIAEWSRRNQCAAAPVDSPAATGVTRREYTGCANDASVVLYTIDGGGHTWPGGEALPEWMLGPTSRSINASELMWSFFREHSLK